MDAAIRKIGNKATGLDELGYSIIKAEAHRHTLVTKLCRRFNKWWNGYNIPCYLKNARVMVFSKDATTTPQVGDIRTISILPTLLKVYEKVVNTRLTDKITDLSLISPT